MVKARIGVAGLGVTVALLFSACGNGPPPGTGGGGSGGSGGGGGGGDVGSKATGATAVATVKETDDLKFNPNKTSVKVGDVLAWDNTSSLAHNVTFDAYSSITSDNMSAGDKFQVKFTKAGTYPYHCTIHPGMDGTVTVG
jgi:plastocyanin